MAKIKPPLFSTKLTKWYMLLAVLRVALVFGPQTGYIHPDEYFQTMDILVGKVFQVQNEPTWEFKQTGPIRSMGLPYFTIGMGYIFLRDFGSLLREYFLLDIIRPYFLLVLPRILMCALSFVVDYCLYKTCTNNNEKFQSRLIMLSSCYVTLVFGTRTFSNTFELVFFALLLHFVCESQTFSNMLNKKKSYINYRYESSKTVVEKAKFHKLRLYLISDSYRNCFVISTITVLGFFNRPTFLAFAVIPIFFWIYRGFGSNSVTVLQFHTRILFFALCSLPAFVFVIIVDSFYYGYIFWGEIGMLDVSINSFVFTPLNFLKYNMDSSNLARHGLHPRWLHAFVNVPLLFTVLGIFSLLNTLKYVYLIVRLKFHELPNIKSIKCLMTASAVVPVLILSVFPHQEPRFLIPILFPLVYLFGMNILPEPDNILVKVPEGSNQDKPIKNGFSKPCTVLLYIWITANILFTIFFGFLHQGGIYSATSYLQRDLSLTSNKTEFHIISSHIYSLPEAFLLQRIPKISLTDNIDLKQRKRLHLYELGSSKSLQDIILKINEIESNKSENKRKTYLLLPSSIGKYLEYELEKAYKSFFLLEVFYPHVSLEAFHPKQYIDEVITCFMESRCENTIYKSAKEFFESFGLALYEIESQ